MLQPGTQIGRYEIQRRLGRGGMGTVYAAHDPVLGRMVAVKVFLGDLDLPNAAERFSREARSAAALNHANIVTIHDFGDFDGEPYIVMEYVQGETLAAIIRRKAAVPFADKLRWLDELCSGVSYAHHLGVIHRDIKPTNLMVDRSGRLKVLDFGIARMLGTLGSSATALIGTPGYMAPEQILGGTIDFRSDVFSIGVVAYELFSYVEAFPGGTLPTITHRVLSAHPTPLVELIPGVNADLAAAVDRALKKTADERFADVEAMRVAINNISRQVEEEFDAGVTVLSPRKVPQPALTPKPGTGSPTRPDSGGAGTMTPPPDARRGSRDALARRRTAQVDACLEQARVLLSEGSLDEARDACEQALTLDELHEGALQLEQVIKAAAASRRAGALLEEAKSELGRGALTLAQNLLQEARQLDPEAPDVKRVERDLRLARVEQERLRHVAEMANATIESGNAALSRGEIEVALAFARQALELQGDSERARAIEKEAMRRLDEETDFSPAALEFAPTMGPMAPVAGVGAGASAVATAATVMKSAAKVVLPPVAAKAKVLPAKTPSAAKREWRAPRIPSPLPALQSLAGGVTRKVATLSKRDRMIAVGAVAGILVVAAGIAVAVRVLQPVPTGAVMIDAVPWATVTAIEGDDGTRLELPPVASTPIALDIPAGTYRITLAGPPPESEARVITVNVVVGSRVALPAERFKTLTPEEYFEPYLAAPVAPAVADEFAAAPAAAGAPAVPEAPQ